MKNSLDINQIYTPNELSNAGINKFYVYLKGVLDCGNTITINGTRAEYCAALIKMYAEIDGEYAKCTGSGTITLSSRPDYFGVFSVIHYENDPIGRFRYRLMPGSYSKDPLKFDDYDKYTIKFTDGKSTYYLLYGEICNKIVTANKAVSFVSPRPCSAKESLTEIKHCKGFKSLQDFVEWAKNSEQSQQALLADGLSENGFNILLSKMTQNMLQDNNELMTKLVNKTLEAQYKKNLQYKYKPYDTENKIKNPTLDIYNPSVLRKSISILKQDHKLLIVGESGSGKSRLAALLAQKLTNKIIDSESSDGRYQHIWIKNVDGEMLWYTGQDSTLFGNLNIFINHINDEIKRDPNNINQNYVFILNEIQRTDIGAISGNLFESWSSGTLPDDIPNNLYIICTACSNSDFELDEQIFQRFGHVELDYLRKENEELRSKLLINIAANHESDSNRCSDIIAKCQELNDAEEYQVINMRYLFAMINGGKIRNHINEQDLTIQGQKILKELIDKGYYDY